MVRITRRALLGGLLYTAALPAVPVYPDKLDLLYYLDARNRRQPVTSARAWNIRRKHILDNMQLVMGPLPYRPVALQWRVDSVTTEKGITRRKIRYQAQPDDEVPAWLLTPESTRTRLPAVLCLHQTVRIGKDEPAGLGGLPNLHYALELARRGFVTLAPDYPNFGEYEFDPYARGYVSATMKGILNHMRAVDLLQTLSVVDPHRIGVCGHSLGGHNALFAASFDPRIQAVVTSCGFTSFAKYFGGDLTGWSHKGYMPRIAERYDKSPDRMPFDFPEVLGAIAPRALFINAPKGDANFEFSGVVDCIQAVRPVYSQIFARPEALVADTPDAGHDFPPAVRERAWRFLERNLTA